MQREARHVALQPAVLSLLALTFVSSATVWAAVPYLPIYLLGAEGFPAHLVGLAVAASSVGMLLGQYPMARIASRVSIRAFFVVSLLVEAVGMIGVLLAVMWPGLGGLILIVALRGVTGVARAGIAQATRVAVRRVSTSEKRAEVFGLVGSADIAGITLGVFLAGLAASASVSLVFIAGAVFCVASAPLVIRLPKQPAPEAAPQAESAAAMRLRDISKPLTILLLFTVATTALIGVYNTAWGPYLFDRGASEGVVGMLFALFTIPFVVLAPLFGRWATTHRRRVFAIVVGTAVACVAALCYPLLSALAVVVVVELIAASGSAAAEPSLDALISDISPSEEVQSKVFGIAGTVSSAVSAGASIFAGILLPIGVDLPFLVAGIVAGLTLIAGALVLATIKRGSRQQGVVSAEAA